MRQPKSLGQLALTITVAIVLANNDDLFNYGTRFLDDGGRNSFPQTEWDSVTCDDVDVCSGYPEKYPFAFFSIAGDSNCRWCPERIENINCGLHRQSPIDLLRNRAVVGHPRQKDCPDYHFFAFERDTCTFDDFKDQFKIERYALQLHVPILPNGNIDCVDSDGQRAFAKLDYSKGFPDWWNMARVDISVPSQHVQEGNRYAAEVTLAHFYEVEHVKNQLGHVGIFLQDYDDAVSWPFLDKLICSWRKEEEKVRKACGLPPAQPYGRCSLFRNQTPTDEWLVEAGEKSAQDRGTSSPLQPQNVTKEPTTLGPAMPAKATRSLEPSLSPTVEDLTKLPTVALVSSIQPSGAVANESTLPPVASTSDTPTTAPTARESSSPTRPVPASSPLVLLPVPPLDVNKTAAPTNLVLNKTAAPTKGISVSQSPTEEPTLDSTTAPSVGGQLVDFDIPAAIDCRGSVNMERLCEGSDPCCESVRSDTKFCWEAYDTLGPALSSACYHCCKSPKIVGPATPPKAGLPQTIQCSSLENPQRLCNSGGCCSDPDNRSAFCNEQKLLLGSQMEEACYYCCREPQVYKVTTTRRDLKGSNPAEIPEGSRVVEAMGKKFLLRKENYEKKLRDDKTQYKTHYEDVQRRSLQTVHAIDYEDIDWYAYEWLKKVGTEYYFRYEGTMLVPPCWETVHWRVMKDPIRVHKRQIDELNRLLAWRLNPETCQVDTAGIVSDDGNSVAVNREVQYNTDIHRMVFCECTDWVSNYEADQIWCKGSNETGNYERLYDRPYSFDTGGEWIPP